MGAGKEVHILTLVALLIVFVFGLFQQILWLQVDALFVCFLSVVIVFSLPGVVFSVIIQYVPTGPICYTFHTTGLLCTMHEYD